MLLVLVRFAHLENKVLTQRITPWVFNSDFISGLSDSHKDAIRKIGFGGFLDLDLASYPSSFAKSLVLSFDVDRLGMFFDSGEYINVNKEDVHLVYGVPLGGKVIVEPKDKVEIEWKFFLKRWRTLFELEKGTPTISQLTTAYNKLKTSPVNNDFIWHFLLCVVNCCMRSTNNRQMNYKFLYNCMDVTQICKLDWSFFVLKNLVLSVEDWKDKSSYFTGPLPFLLICYFHRLQRGIEVYPRRFPLIFVWNKKLMNERMVIERKRGFGNGKILDKMEHVRNVQADVQEEGSSSNTSDMMVFIKNFEKLAKVISSDMKDMYLMLDKVRNMFEEGDICVQMRNFINNIWGKYTST
ncbi:hypothetical protein M5689_024657 [Euphorbia peplus]|nr:hypothetical protein M5689_024657 [Euphorbia peplus]